MKNLGLFAVAVALCACSGRDSGRTDSALTRDLALASQAQASQPQFQDTAATQAGAPASRTQRIGNAPRTRTIPRTTPAAEAPHEAAREIGAGSGFALASQQRICTTTNRPGDRFVATLTSPVVGSNGAVIPSGSSVVLEVAGTAADGSSISLRPVSVEFNGMSYPVTGDVATQSGLERTKIVGDPNGDKKKVIGGAIAGAIIGQMIGHNTKGTIIGAATGAAGGAVAAKVTEKYESCLPVGGTMRLTLGQGIVL
jgi:outer membrane lipoprotein SlyB